MTGRPLGGKAEAAVDWWAERPGIDRLAGLACTVSGLVLGSGGFVWISMTRTQRIALQSSVVALGAALLAFVVVPAAIVGSLSPQGRLKAVLERHGHELSAATASAGIMAMGVMVSGISAIAIDAEALRYVVLGFVVAGLLGALRVLELLRVAMSVNNRDEKDPLMGGGPRPPASRTIRPVPIDSNDSE